MRSQRGNALPRCRQIAANDNALNVDADQHTAASIPESLKATVLFSPEATMFDRFLRSLLVLALVSATMAASASADDRAALQPLREEMWVLMTLLPMFALVVRPVGGGPFPLAVMNHGIAIGEKERSFFPTIEFRDAAFWFARQRYFVVAPIRYGVTAINKPELGLFGLFFGSVGSCDNPNFRAPGLMIATLDQWVIDFMEHEGMVTPGKAIVVGSQAALGEPSHSPV
jgi:hypothetical protein